MKVSGKRAGAAQRWRRWVVSSARERAADFQNGLQVNAAAFHSETAARIDGMVSDADRRLGTRKRSLPMAAAGFVTLGVLTSMVYQNLLAVNFNTGQGRIQIFSNYLDAQKAAAYLAPSTKGGTGATQEGVAELGIATASLAGFCAITKESLPVIGDYSLMITAGQNIPDASAFDGTGVPVGVSVDTLGRLSGTSKTEAITAANLFLNSNQIEGFGNKIAGLNLGQSADTVAASAGLTWPTPNANPPQAGNFGLYADQLNVGGLGGAGYGLNLAGNITLPKLGIKVVPGAKTQNDCS